MASHNINPILLRQRNAATAPAEQSTIARTTTSHGTRVGTSAPSHEITDADYPSAKALCFAAKIALDEKLSAGDTMGDPRGIMFDYFFDTMDTPTHPARAFLGVNERAGIRVLIRSSDEYTSNIKRYIKADNCSIILTENSIYIVASSLKQKYITNKDMGLPEDDLSSM